MKSSDSVTMQILISLRKNPAKLHVMWRDFYLHEATAPGLLLGKI